jgi:hypothetical protein
VAPPFSRLGGARGEDLGVEALAHAFRVHPAHGHHLAAVGQAEDAGGEALAAEGRLGGAARRTRTPNPQIRSLPLYPLSYGCTVVPYSMSPAMGEEAEA